MCVFVVSDDPVKLTTVYKTYYELTKRFLQAFYKLTKEAYYTVIPKVSRGGFENFKFTDNFQIDNVPGWCFSAQGREKSFFFF